MTVTQEIAQGSGRGRAYVFLLLTTLFWAGNAVAARLSVGEISPMVLVGLRWAGTLTLLLAVNGRQFRRDLPALKGRLGYVVAMGVVGYTSFNALFYLSAQYTTAVNIGILQGTMPVAILIGSVLLFGTRLKALQTLGVAITLAGVVLVVSRGRLEVLAGLEFNKGDLLMLVTCMFYAAYSLGLRNRPQVSPISLMTAFAIPAAIAAVPLVVAEIAMGNAMAPTPTGWAIVVFVTVFPSMLAQILFMKGVGLIGPARAGVFINLVPVFAAMLAVAVLGEAFRWYHLAALVMVLAGIWLAERRAG